MNVLQDARVAAVVDIANRLGRKFESTDVPALGAPAVELATNYVQTYDGDFEYIVKLKGQVLSGKLMNDQQIKGALNTMVAEYRRATKQSAQSNMIQTTIDVSNVPPSMYKVGNTIIRVDHPSKGKWAGWVFVKDDRDKRLGKAAPGDMLNMVDDVLLISVMKEIVADPAQAVANYGRFTGTCGVCGIKLDDPESVAQGVGPVCIKRFSIEARAQLKEEAAKHIASTVTPALPSARKRWVPTHPTTVGVNQNVNTPAPTAADSNAIASARPASRQGYFGPQHVNAWQDEDDLDIAADLADLEDLTDEDVLKKAAAAADHGKKVIKKVGEARKPKPMAG